jgi:arylsulfatase A-like enzyme
MRARQPFRASSALLAAVIMLLLERGVSGASGGSLLLPWDASFFLFAGLVGLEAAALVLLHVAEWAGSLGEAKGGRALWGYLSGGIVAFLAALYPALVTGEALSSGAWIAQQSWAPVFRIGVALGFSSAIGALIVWRLCLGHRLARGGEARKKTSTKLLVAALLLVSLTAIVADTRVMVGLHREFHLSAFALAALSGLLFADALILLVRGEATPGRGSLVATGVVLASLVSCAFMGQGPRRSLVLHSGAAAALIRTFAPASPSGVLLAELERLESTPPPGLREEPPSVSLPEAPNGKPWNVVLIVVDTLRADAVPPGRRKGRRSSARRDTPFLNKWVRTAFRFRTNYAQATRTNRSMPAMFRSLHPHEHPHRNGQPLGETMAALGRTPVAVVPNIIFEGRESRARQLLRGFEYVDTYDKLDQQSQLERTRALLTKVKDRPFFAWLHYYAMHAPGFDGRSLEKSDGSMRARYVRSLRWTDKQIGSLIEELETQGLAEHTIVILAADHGESLGANGVARHGPTVYEEEIRTPLIVSIPGLRGRELEVPVGNVDILPTLLNIIGVPRDPRHRGRSLIPLFVDEEKEGSWDRDYYMENSQGSIVAAVHGEQKLIYDTEAGVFHRYDVAEDPKEKKDLFGLDAGADLEMQRRLMHLNPGLFAEELELDATLSSLQRRLAQQDAAAPGVELSFLLGLASKAEDDQTQSLAVKLFETTRDDEVRLLILRHLRKRDPGAWDDRVQARIEELEGGEEELAFVAGLARQDQGAFDTRYAAARLAYWQKQGGLASCGPWLRLLRKWRGNPARELAPTLSSLLRAALDDETSTPDQLALILANLAALEREVEDLPPGLATQLVQLLDHDEFIVQVWAARGLGKVASLAEVPALEATLRGGNLATRQAALLALAEVQGADAVGTIVTEARRENLFTVPAIRVLAKLGSVEALDYLDWVATEHYNKLVQKRAIRAANKIRNRHGLPVSELPSP